jgi:hypothetical protein
MAAMETIDPLDTLIKVTSIGGPGLATVFMILWWLERKERLASQKRERKQTYTMTRAFAKITNVMRDFNNMMISGRKTSPEEYELEDPNEYPDEDES